jgi:subtilisin family serine protease
MPYRLSLAAAAAILSFGILQAGGPPREYIVELQAGQSIDEVNAQHRTITTRRMENSRLYLVRNDDGNAQTLNDLIKDPRVNDAEENRRFRLDFTDTALNVSPLLGQEMFALLDTVSLTNLNGVMVLSAYANQPAATRVGLDQVRSISSGVAARVAYIDTGIDPYHPALMPWIDGGVDVLEGRSVSEFEGLSQEMFALLDQEMFALLDHRFFFLLNNSLASILDSTSGSFSFPPAFGHGTLVAGMIHLAAPEARIVPIKAFDGYGYTNVFALIDGIDEAIQRGVDVLNLSFTTTEDSKALRRAIVRAVSSGIVVVSAAGNGGRGDRDIYPAAYPGVIGVAATEIDDRLAAFSNYGQSVAISAPGAFVISTAPGGRYAAAWGTSFSAPIVSGTVSLLSSINGRGHGDGKIVVNTADSIDSLNPGYEKKLGKGRLNAVQALRLNK